MNIINNRIDLDLGEELNNFRAQTDSMTPTDRGVALDKFEHVRNVHNSFSTSIDRMVVDVRLKQDITADQKAKRAAASKRPRKKRKQEVFEEEEDNGFHFVAYVPAGGFVWKMDGMEVLPRKIGALSDDTDWLMMVLPELQATWESASSSDLEVSLLSLTARIDTTELEADEEKMERIREDWGASLTGLMRLQSGKGGVKATIA